MAYDENNGADRVKMENDLSRTSLEALREELSSLDAGMAELIKRRRDVTTAINIKMDDTRMHLGSSHEHFAKLTGQYDSEVAIPTEHMDVRRF